MIVRSAVPQQAAQRPEGHGLLSSTETKIEAPEAQRPETRQSDKRHRFAWKLAPSLKPMQAPLRDQPPPPTHPPSPPLSRRMATRRLGA